MDHYTEGAERTEGLVNSQYILPHKNAIRHSST